MDLLAGDAEEHALLLCALLLGFGLDAYVCTGRDAQGPHTWRSPVQQLHSSGEQHSLQRQPHLCNRKEGVRG